MSLCRSFEWLVRRPYRTLGACSVPTLMMFAVVGRLVVVAWMVLSRVLAWTVSAPLLLGGSPETLDAAEASYDSCEFFYPEHVGHASVLNHWDSVHFRYVAKHGYSHEHVHAFFPGAALVFHTLECLGLPAIMYNALGIVAYAIAAASLREFTKALPMVQNLTSGRGHTVDHVLQQRVVGAVCFAFFLSPTNVFTIVSYTESFFACFCFLGLYCASRDDTSRFPGVWFVCAVANFFLSAMFRSNGFLLGVVMMLPSVWDFVVDARRHLATKQGIRWTLALVVRGVSCIVLLIPYVWSNFDGWSHYCQQATADSSQCSVLGFYQMIQAKYWNVGWFKQWNVTNVPNFFIAAPSVTIGLRALWRLWNTTGVREKRHGVAMWCRVVTCHALMLLFLYYLAITTIHVQVVNRLVFACPALYWALGSQLAEEPKGFWTAAYVGYALVCSTMGPLMFAHHMNWT